MNTRRKRMYQSNTGYAALAQGTASHMSPSKTKIATQVMMQCAVTFRRARSRAPDNSASKPKECASTALGHKGIMSHKRLILSHRRIHLANRPFLLSEVFVKSPCCNPPSIL
ncbi:hypothetical protein Pst134EB_026094 [Puccinia striiformis f. sp. tritici]|nr:hypothetical protein Pst134EB_026094 [Puccinia striiformis f. sp. tritici]